MESKDPYCRGFVFDQRIRIATDNVMGQITRKPGIVHPIPLADFFLLLDGTDFLLLDGTDFLLL